MEDYCPHLGGICEHEYTDCPLEVQHDDCIKMPAGGGGEEEENESNPPGGPG